ncbi:hypothetical protein CVT25_009803 [Psilocybe cyanescens]|uniref:Uncharacterized protein n=1 Tax=Psilocybe cyanescens TaxID=93625 RepID=A0A409X822_PSICY|nr:hypothetical protein CVT25_009803 [Psilocybe cyanescens]
MSLETIDQQLRQRQIQEKGIGKEKEMKNEEEKGKEKENLDHNNDERGEFASENTDHNSTGKMLSLSLQIPGTATPSASTSEPSSSAPSSEPASPNPLADSDILSPCSPPSETPPSSTSTHASASSLSLAVGAAAGASANASTEHCPAAAASLSVKFAPLPELAPRKRRSTTPLGMAARGQLMRRRKGHVSVQQQQAAALQEAAAAAQPNWTPQEREEQRLRQEELAARYAHYQASAAALAAREEEAQLEEEEEEELAKAARHELQKMERPRQLKAGAGVGALDEKDKSLGKAVKGFLRRVGKSKDAESGIVGKKESSDKVQDGTGTGTENVLKRRKSDIGRRPRVASSPTVVSPPVPPLPLRPILASLTSNIITPSKSLSIAEEVPPQEVHHAQEQEQEEGGVWEEEIGDAFPMNVSQTETIVEGRAVYASVKTTAKVEAGTKTSNKSADAKPSKSSSAAVSKNPSKTLSAKS